MLVQILFFFAAIGVFNSLLLSLYLLFVKKNNRIGDYLLGILLFLFCVRVGVSCFYFFGEMPPYLIKTGLIANLFIGPTLFCLITSTTKSVGKTMNEYVLQIILLSFGLTLAWFLSDFYFWDHILRFVIHGILTLYLVYSVWILRVEMTTLFTKSEIGGVSQKNTIILLAVWCVCIGFAVSLVSTYILGPIVFSLVFYSTFTFFLLQLRGKKKSYVKKIEQTQFDTINQKLDSLMDDECLYRSPDLSLDLLANRLGVRKHFLSQMLNDNLKKPFYQYVNEYRIDEACRMLAQEKRFSVEAIGYEVGFRSKSAFFATFKKFKGMTPSKYRSIN